VILVFGANGQLGRALAVLPGITALTRAQADLRDAGACAAVIADMRPDAVINAAAFTHVDAAQDAPDLAMAINARAPAAMARACAGLGVPLVHVSTEYVFDGAGAAAYAPDSPTGPLNIYGVTKLAGEDAVRAACGVHAVLRTSWVFSEHGANFVTTMLRLGRGGAALNVVDDQIGGPTFAGDLALACVRIARALIADPAKSGTYHYAGAPDIARADFARAVFTLAGLEVTVRGIASADYRVPAARPLNSRLDCGATMQVFGLARPDWHTGLAQVTGRL